MSISIIAICGPYFGDGQNLTIANNIKEAEEYAIALANFSIGFFCPHTHTRHFEKKAQAEESFYHELDIRILVKCADAALFTPRWKTSRGACHEQSICEMIGLQCFYPQSPDDMNDIIEWNKINSRVYS
jgi:hypothetical protein